MKNDEEILEECEDWEHEYRFDDITRSPRNYWLEGYKRGRDEATTKGL
jgi:hypothetical protein